MNNPEKERAKKMLDRAKIGLMNKGSVFLMTVAFSLRQYWDDTCLTAWVDGKTMGINPKFFEELPDGQRIFVIAHEAWHVAYNHIVRRGDRDPELHNQAGDYVINLMLQNAGYELWPHCLCDKRFANMSTNQVYEILKKEEEKKPGRHKQQQQGGMTGDIRQPGDGSGSKEDQQQQAEIEAHVKGVLVKAMTQAKMAGEKQIGMVPAEIQRGIEELLDPVLPWNILLFNFMQDMTKDDYSWRRPNRRFHPEYYLPTQYSEALQHVTIAIDTSGSITNKELQEILSEIIHIKRTFNPKRLTILDCDARIHNVYDVDEFTNVEDLKFSGGGGTNFAPVIEYCNKNNTNALLYFSDLYGPFPKEEPSYPVIWLCYSSSKPAPFGETVYYHGR